MKKQLTKKEKRIVTGIFIVAAAAMLVKGVMQQPQILRNADQIAELEEKIEYENKRIEEIDALQEKVDTDEYIEKVAREKLGLVKSDEIVFIDISGE